MSCHGYQAIQADFRGPPGGHGVRLRGLHAPAKNRPEKSLLAPKKKKGGRNNQGIITSRFRGGGHKQHVPHHRLQAQARQRRGHGASGRVRPEPHCPHRAAAVRGRAKTKAYILAPDGLKAGDKVMSGESEAVEPQARQLHAAVEGAAGHDDPQRRNEPGQGGQMCRSRRLQRDARRPARRTGRSSRCPAARCAACRCKCRATIGSVSQRRAHEHQHGQGRPHALEGPQAAQPRHQP